MLLCDPVQSVLITGSEIGKVRAGWPSPHVASSSTNTPLVFLLVFLKYLPCSFFKFALPAGHGDTIS
jgi:hypothetical protein